MPVAVHGAEWRMAKTILVVEDDTVQRELLALHLLNAGYVVQSVKDGLEAAASCLNVVPDLIISDVRMPRMSGFQMIRVLKQEPSMKDIPVIFLSMDEAGRDQGTDLGAVAYLNKPFKPAVLLKTVERHLSGEA